MTTTRRIFMGQSLGRTSALAGLLALTQTVGARAQTLVQESDPQAQALGYRNDSARVEATRYPRHSPMQTCAGCALFQGQPSEATAACAVFGNQRVSAQGWCSAWSKRP